VKVFSINVHALVKIKGIKMVNPVYFVGFVHSFKMVDPVLFVGFVHSFKMVDPVYFVGFVHSFKMDDPVLSLNFTSCIPEIYSSFLITSLLYFSFAQRTIWS
jgi:hypothetical protein